MTITLCVNNSERNKLNKTLSDLHEFTGTLKGETNVIDPTILMELENPTGFNYAYIPEFGRYYFIREMVCVRNGLWLISLHVDALQSFHSYILECSVILSDTENTGKEMYLSGNVWKSEVKELTDIINFPNGLSNTGYFILITSGG